MGSTLAPIFAIDHEATVDVILSLLHYPFILSLSNGSPRLWQALVTQTLIPSV